MKKVYSRTKETTIVPKASPTHLDSLKPPMASYATFCFDLGGKLVSSLQI
jgi:hypothetical protein